MGQLYQLELMLLAAMGTEYIRRHPWGYLPLWRRRNRAILRKLERTGIAVIQKLE
jgi:hypothetical protein